MEKKPPRFWDPVTALQFVAAMVVLAWHLVRTDWTDHLGIFYSLVLIGSGLGLLLGYSKFRQGMVVVFSVVFTLFFVYWRLLALVEVDLSLHQQVLVLFDRIVESTRLLFQSQPLTDSVLFMLNMSMQYWLVAFLGGFVISRYGNAFLPLVFGLILNLIIDVNDPASSRAGFATGIYLILSALLLSRLHHVRTREDWINEGVRFDKTIPLMSLRNALTIIIVVIIFSWGLSGYQQQTNRSGSGSGFFTTLFQDVRNRIADMASPLRGGTPIEVIQYGNQFSLGTGAVPSDEIVFTVASDQPDIEGIPFYWRIRSYDRYEAGQWWDTIEGGEDLAAGDPRIQNPMYGSRRLIQFKISTRQNINFLYAPSFPYRMSRPAYIQRELAANKIVDIPAVTLPTILRSGDEYTVSSLIGVPPAEALRLSASIYPSWVADKYLALPDNFSPRLAELAHSLSSDLSNNYDKTVAINDWLRANIDYQRTIPAPPEDQDPIEWVVFEHQEAFCNYYAAAEVLMLRSIGIPARLVVGYASGNYSVSDKTFTVTESDAHAWPEVYFTNFGWIEFEPTAAEDNLVREPLTLAASAPTTSPNLPGGPLTEMDPFDQEEAPAVATRVPNFFQRFVESVRQPRSLATLGFILALATFVYLLNWHRGLRPDRKIPVVIDTWFQRKGWPTPQFLRWWSDHEKLLPIEKELQKVKRINRFFKISSDVGLTPREHTQILIARVPEALMPAQALLLHYETEIYGDIPSTLSGPLMYSREIRRAAVLRALKDLFKRAQRGRTKPRI